MIARISNEILYHSLYNMTIYMIPPFNGDGNIPVGEYETSLPEFKIRFVEGFIDSITRDDLYNSYINYNVFLSTFNVAEKEWVVGSFTSAKINPSDVDLIVYINAILLIKSHEENDFWQNLDEAMIYRTYKCHTHLVLTYPSDDPRYEHALHRKEYWEKWFRLDRSDRPRGIIKFNLVEPSYLSDLRVEAGV